MWWLIGDVVVNRRCGGSLKMWWLIGDVVAHMEMWWLIGDVVAHMEMWWLIYRCGGSYIDVVAQMEIWWLIGDVVFHRRCGGSLEAHQTSGAEVPGSYPASPTMILMHCRIIVMK